MAAVQPPTPPPTAPPGAGDAPLSQEDQLVSLLDAADADEATPPAEEDEDAAPDQEAEEQDEEEQPAPTDEMDREYEVRPDGKPEKVTLREALRRYTHIATAERRMADATEARKALDLERSTELGKLSQVRGEYAKRLEVLAKSLEDGEAEPDWDAIRRDRPDEYPQLLADWQLRDRKRQKVAAERERVADEQEQEAARQLQATLAREQQKLHEFLPDLADRTKGPALKADLLAAGEEYGYTAEEVESVSDHRAIRLLHDAAQYRKLLARKAALGKAPEGKTLTPGPKATVPSGLKARGAAYDRLKKTGSKEDAVAVFLGMLDDDERSTARKR